jgi:putative DNA primase/helicase
MLQERLKWLFQADMNDRLDVLPSELLWTGGHPLNLNAPHCQARVDSMLADLIKRGRRPDLVILDNLSSLATGQDENDNGALDRVLGWLMKLRYRGFSLLLVHHAGKSGGQRGASRREDLLDTVIKLALPPSLDAEDSRAGAQFLIEMRSENGGKIRGAQPIPDHVEVALGRDSSGGPLWRVIHTEPEYLRAARIIHEQGPLSTAALGKLMDLTRQAAGKHVARLRKRGFLVDGPALELNRKGLQAIDERVAA